MAEDVVGRVGLGTLVALVLGGGYGRGEGGVRREGRVEAPYNDLEFYVLVRGIGGVPWPSWSRRLRELGHELSGREGIEIEFKVLTPQQLRRSAPSMFYYDLVVGHRTLVGTNEWVEGVEHHRDASRIPLAEATRLLFNRCSGLLFSQQRLWRTQFDSDDADFVGRNLAKLQLALGDVLLTSFGQYHWSCLERQARLSQLPTSPDRPWQKALEAHHRSGVAFKLHPVRSRESRSTLQACVDELRALAEQVWVWVESRRLGVRFVSAQDYAQHPISKCPESAPIRNRLVHAKVFGPAAAFGKSATYYPRQRLFHALCALLWNPSIATDLSSQSAVQHELRTPAQGFPDLVRAYEHLWHRFN